MKKIAVFRALQLGDMLCAIPFFRALRSAYPDAEITLIGLSWAHAFVKRFHAYVDQLIVFPGFPGFPESEPNFSALPDFFKRIKEEEFDLAIQIHGSGQIVNGLLALFDVKQTAGFYLREKDCLDPETFLRYPEGIPEIHRFLELSKHLGIPLQGDALEFPICAQDEAELERAGLEALTDQEFICIHPGARYLSRRWMPERFAEAGDYFAARGYRIVVTGATEDEELVRRVRELMQAPSISTAGRLSLGGFGALLRHARLLISNDTGVSHIAAALRTPSVIIVTGSDPGRWLPLDRELHIGVMQPMDCRPCMHFSCPIGHPCALQVTTQSVIQEAEKLLEIRCAR